MLKNKIKQIHRAFPIFVEWHTSKAHSVKTGCFWTAHLHAPKHTRTHTRTAGTELFCWLRGSQVLEDQSMSWHSLPGWTACLSFPAMVVGQSWEEWHCPALGFLAGWGLAPAWDKLLPEVPAACWGLCWPLEGVNHVTVSLHPGPKLAGEGFNQRVALQKFMMLCLVEPPWHLQCNAFWWQSPYVNLVCLAYCSLCMCLAFTGANYTLTSSVTCFPP